MYENDGLRAKKENGKPKKQSKAALSWTQVRALIAIAEGKAIERKHWHGFHDHTVKPEIHTETLVHDGWYLPSKLFSIATTRALIRKGVLTGNPYTWEVARPMDRLTSELFEARHA